MEEDRKHRRKRRSKKRRPRPPQVTPEDVRRFLATATARRWYAFSDSNVKRFVIRALFDLLEEAERLERENAAWRANSGDEPPALPSWVGRISGRRAG